MDSSLVIDDLSQVDEFYISEIDDSNFDDIIKFNRDGSAISDGWVPYWNKDYYLTFMVGSLPLRLGFRLLEGYQVEIFDSNYYTMGPGREIHISKPSSGPGEYISILDINRFTIRSGGGSYPNFYFYKQ